MTFPARYESLEAVSLFVRRACLAARLDETDSYNVQLSVDEACSNIIEHGYGGGSEDAIEIRYRISPEALTIFLDDHGKPFDGSSVCSPDLAATLGERRSGGLGIFLMRRYMDEVEYRRLPFPRPGESTIEQGNRLTLLKRKTKPG